MNKKAAKSAHTGPRGSAWCYCCRRVTFLCVRAPLNASSLRCIAFLHDNIHDPSHSLMNCQLTTLTSEGTSSKTANLNIVYNNKETPKTQWQLSDLWKSQNSREIKIDAVLFSSNQIIQWIWGWRIQYLHVKFLMLCQNKHNHVDIKKKKIGSLLQIRPSKTRRAERRKTVNAPQPCTFICVFSLRVRVRYGIFGLFS